MSYRRIGRASGGGGVAPTQAQIDAAVASNPGIATQTELDAEKARIDAMVVSQTTQDTNITALQGKDVTGGAQKAGDATKLELTTADGPIEIDVAWLQGDPDGTTTFTQLADDTLVAPTGGNAGDAAVVRLDNGDTHYYKNEADVWSVKIYSPAGSASETGTLVELEDGVETAPKIYAPKTIADYVNGKKVLNFGSYGEANAAGGQPRDTIFIIGMQKEAWARTETTGDFAFPGTGSTEDPNWFRIGDIEVVYPGDAGAVQSNKRNLFWLDETQGAVPVAMEGQWYEVGNIGSEKADFVPLTPAPVEITRFYAIEDPANIGSWSWLQEGEVIVGGDTKYTLHLSDRLESFRFDVHDRTRPDRSQRTGLTVEELATGNSDWTLTAPPITVGPLQAGYTRLFHYMPYSAEVGYWFYIDWRLVQNEYEIIIQDRHLRWTDATQTAELRGYDNEYGGLTDLTVRYAASDPAKPTWTELTAYPNGSVVIAKAPTGVAETQDNWFIGEAQSDRPNTIATLDAAEWANWTWQALVPTKQDVVVPTLADRPDPATLLSGSRVSVVADPVAANNVSYTVVGPVDGAGTGYSDFNLKDPQSLLLNNIEVTLRSAGTNAGSSVGLTFVDLDGNNYPASDWVYSADLTQYSGGTATIVTDKATFNGTIGLGRNKAGTVKFYYIGDLPNGLSAITATPANGGSSQGVVVTYQGTNYNDAFAAVGDITNPLYWTTSQEVAATDQAAPLADATEYLAGSVFSAPEPDNTDPDYQVWFNWRVNDGETIADTDIPNGAEAELLAVKPKLTRFGVGTITDEVVVRFPGSNGAQLNDYENTYWSDEIVGAQPAPVLGKEFATGVSSAASTDTEAVKNAATVTLTHYRWVDNGGAALVAIATEAPASGPEFDLAGIAANDTVKWDPVNNKFVPDNVALTGDAVERSVRQLNRGSVVAFGDFQFRVPSSGNSSLQILSPTGNMTVSNFITHWSHQQGGASEEAIAFTASTGWRYFRTQGLTLTQHNNYQEAQFTANGWYYHVGVIVGGSWQNNRFFFTRIRLQAVKGNDGDNGRGIVKSHRSDGVTAIGGTIYTLDHIIYEYTDSTFEDMGFLVAPATNPSSSVLLGSYDSSSFSSSRTFTLPDGRTWQDVLDEFEFVYFLVGGNNLFTHEQPRMFHVDDLTVPNRDLSLTSYQDHGTNSYHMKFRVPFGSGTTITVDNDGSSMQVQRIFVRGIK